MKNLVFFAVISTLILAGGCAFHFRPLAPTRPELGKATITNSYLRALPAPKEKIVAAVYKFRDQTGQYKTASSGVTWSTAVTQGATSMLLKSLEDSGWFITLEREGLSNLLNERKIIRSTRENFSNGDNSSVPPLPPLLYAGITLEGGIISYETNIVTGGYGAKYFGVGASAQYRKDEVSIYLRAVSTQTGRILKTVYTSKTILSQLVDIGVYRYVKYKRLLEVETGYSTNEPPQLCVLEAIEKAVYSLIIEGIADKFWELSNSEDMTSPLIKAYFEEKEQAEYLAQFDTNDRLISRKNNYNSTRVAANKWGLGSHVMAQTYAGDYPNPDLRLAGNFLLKYGLSPRFSVLLSAGGGHIADPDYFETQTVYLDCKAAFNLLPRHRLSPYISLGASLINFWTKDAHGQAIERTKKYGGWKPAVVSGIGFEYFLGSQLGLNFQLENYYSFTDQIDGIVHGKKKDYPWNGQIGLIYYWGK